MVHTLSHDSCFRKETKMYRDTLILISLKDKSERWEIGNKRTLLVTANKYTNDHCDNRTQWQQMI